MRRLAERDLEDVLSAANEAFEALRGAHVLLTGASGFVGSWMLESLLWADRRLALDVRITALVRDPRALDERYARECASGTLVLLRGDVRDSHLEVRPDAIVNAAVPAVDNERGAAELLETITEGALAMIRLAERSGSIPILYASSGAVYGRQPPDLMRIPETFTGGPATLEPRFAYHESKRLAEMMHAVAAARAACRPKIARMFAFAGPRLPLDRHFAIGNFIGNAIRGETLAVSGDGTPVRTYLHASDMAAWLWTILARGVPARAYNVGSEIEYAIADVAHLVARAAGRDARDVEIARASDPAIPAERYVPDTSRIRGELGVVERVDLASSIRRALDFYATA